MITRIKFASALLARLNGRDSIEFKPGINILIGPNGSGKSTILGALRDRAGELITDGAPVHYMAGESVKSAQTTFGGKSHGESMLHELSGLSSVTGHVTILLDEPEIALSIDNVVALCQTISRGAQSGVQYIISSHHPMIWTLKDANLIHMTEPKWMKGHLSTLKKRLAAM